MVKNPYRSGAIMGLIGGIAFVAILVVGYAGAEGVADGASNQGVSSILSSVVPACILVNTLIFGAGFVTVRTASRKALLGLSVLALVLSLIGTIGMVLFLNVMALCIGPLFLWEPILQLVGAVKMVNASLKTND